MSLLIKNAKLLWQNELTDIFCEGGVIKSIAQNLDIKAQNVIDAQGFLTSPTFTDPHIHLDKVNIVDVVRANESGTLKEAIEIIWDKKKIYTDEDIVMRAEDVIKKAIKNGTLAMRTHVDIDTIGELRPLKGILALREKYKHLVDIQIIVFPQEGILKNPGCDKLIWQAMEMGADIVGGMPANENSPEDSKEHIKICFEVAKAFDADIDMHVDETDDASVRTLEMLADLTIENNWQGRVTAGHTCALAAYDDEYANMVIQKCKKAQINFITNPVTNLMLQGRHDKQPIRRGITRVKQLIAEGLNVSCGQDCVKDTFYPLGSADMLQVANITAHAAQMTLPEEIQKVYDMITINSNKILGCDDCTLREGAKANIVIIAAKDARDAIRLTPERLYVIRQGEIIAKTSVKTEFFF